MKPSDRLKEIEENHHPFQNKFADPDAIYWLIARVKSLSGALEEIRDYDDYLNGQHEIARKALEGSDE